MLFQATPKLSEDKVRQCVDTRLGGEYPPKAVAKVLTVIHFVYHSSQFSLFFHFLANVVLNVLENILLLIYYLKLYAYEPENSAKQLTRGSIRILYLFR